MTVATIVKALRSQKRVISLVSAATLLAGGASYTEKVTQCDWHSKFCATALPGGKSEVVVGWLDGWNHLDIFKQDYPD